MIRTNLRAMVGNRFLQHVMFALAGAAQHAAGRANAGMGEVATASNLCSGVHHHDQLAELVCQLARDVSQQGGLACTAATCCVLCCMMRSVIT